MAPHGPICSQSPSAKLVGEGAAAARGTGRSHSEGLGEEGDGEATTTAPEGDGSDGTAVAERVQGEQGEGGKSTQVVMRGRGRMGVVWSRRSFMATMNEGSKGHCQRPWSSVDKSLLRAQ